ncbi:MAG: hypothetical protein ACIRXY_05540 [Ligilactobacillus animalis]|uniref:hypothetical protein n=1 Tax=Ligilactobacillus animalis TaxID=1605 RepID=UPI0037F156A7
MYKSIKTISLLLLSALTLAGCSNTVDNSNKSASSSSAKVKKNSSSRDNKKVTAGELLKVGQWHDDPTSGKVTLERIVSPTNAEINYGPMNFKIKNVKLLKYEPKTDQQKELISTTFDSANVTSPSYVIQVTYTLDNSSDSELQFNGIKSLVPNYGQQLSMGSGLIDEGVGSAIATHAHKDEHAQALINSDDVSKLNQLTFNLDSIANTDTFETVADAPESLTIDFK